MWKRCVGVARSNYRLQDIQLSSALSSRLSALGLMAEKLIAES
jgi:hypothetical protein